MKDKGENQKNLPLVTVLLPVRNGEKWIRESLESLKAQTFTDFEVLLIDDGSTDNSIVIAQECQVPGLRILTGPRQGLARALEFGVNNSRGSLIARQDQDDVSLPQRLERQVHILECNSEILLLGSRALEIDEEGKIIGTIKVPSSNESISQNLILFNPFIHSSVMFRKWAVVQVGNYWAPSSEPYPEDFDLWSRICALGECRNTEETLIKYRRTATSLMATAQGSLAKGGSQIAIKNFKHVLGGKVLSPKEEVLISFFYVRDRKISLNEAVRLGTLLLRARFASGFRATRGGLPLRTYLAPFKWVFVVQAH